ncbi:MAG TPA: lipo-like protein [Thioalkalivibrio sp.]|nr:lipo-like protein [Thioalkalivibrio sp.]
MGIIEGLGRRLGRRLAAYLNQPAGRYQPFAVHEPGQLADWLQPGDVLLVEGNRRISTAIKYLTQSTWSHAALYIGDAIGERTIDDEPLCLIEADLQQGVIAIPLSRFRGLNLRICRPVGMTSADRTTVITFMVKSLGKSYDLKNIFDLMRYLLPEPPVPQRFRRRMLALGSGDPTRAICSTLIAEAFQAVRYPILPNPIHGDADDTDVILEIRHHSLFTPRDFDLSPYFRVVKPFIEHDFDYQRLRWAGDQPAAGD